jgi:hypothetical protein
MKFHYHLAAIFAALTLPLLAQQMSYQGRLTDNTGAAVAGATAPLTFSIWDAATGGNKVWGDQVITADLIDGRFSVKLGPTDATSRQLSAAFSGARFIQIQVGSNAPLPRQEMLAAPLAFSALNANLNGAGFKSSIARRPTIGSGNTNPNFPFDGADGLLIETGFGESSGIFLNGNTVALYSPGNTTHVGVTGGCIFSVYDEDTIQSGAVTPPAFSVQNGGGFTAFGSSRIKSDLNVEGNLAVNGFVNGQLAVNIVGGSSTTARIKERAGDFFALAIDDESGTNALLFQTITGNTQFILSQGTATKPGGGSWGVTSDRRLKKNIEPMTGALDKLSQLEPVTFEYIDPEKMGVSGVQNGFVAQQVEPIFPQWVKDGASLPTEDGKSTASYKSLSITGFESLTVAALKELRTEQANQLQTLKTDSEKSLQALQSENEELKARLKRLEDRMGSLAP